MAFPNDVAMCSNREHTNREHTNRDIGRLMINFSRAVLIRRVLGRSLCTSCISENGAVIAKVDEIEL